MENAATRRMVEILGNRVNEQGIAIANVTQMFCQLSIQQAISNNMQMLLHKKGRIEPKMNVIHQSLVFANDEEKARSNQSGKHL